MKKFFKDNLDFLLIVVIAVIPFVIWLLMSPLASRLYSSSAIFRSLGQITGLLGMILLSISFILAARFKFLDRLFNGLNRVYLKHHIVGAISFCLLLFHPTFLTIQYLFISLKASYGFIFSFNDLAMILGEVGLLIFILLMVITFYLNFKYQNWKITHKYLGIVLLLGGLHMLWIPSDVSNNSILKYYMLLWVILGAYAYFYRTIFGIYKREEYSYELKEVTKVNDSVAELKFIPLQKKLNFSPGQFVFLRFDHATQIENGNILSESHPFSIICSPQDEELSLGIKTLGDYTSMAYLLKPGARCKIEGPFGKFSFLQSNSKRQIWLAGGIGITPFLSMARQISATNSKDFPKVDLYYVVKNNDEAAFMNELQDISEKNENFKLSKYFSDTDGRITAEYIIKNSQDTDKAEVFLCGPLGFMQNLRKQFRKLGIINSKIHSEEFNFN